MSFGFAEGRFSTFVLREAHPMKHDAQPELELPRSAPPGVVITIAGNNEASIWGAVNVGERLVVQIAWSPEGRILHEKYFDRVGRAHGVERQRDDDGHVIWCAQWVHGLMHGSVMMLDRAGRPVVVTPFVRGRGMDIWLNDCGDIVEVREMADGVPHGFVRWGEPTLPWEEEHFSRGKRHGVFRRWTEREALDAGFPEFYVNDECVSQAQYVSAQQTDDSLPAYSEQDDARDRVMPALVHQALQEAKTLAQGFDLDEYLRDADCAIAWDD